MTIQRPTFKNLFATIAMVFLLICLSGNLTDAAELMQDAGFESSNPNGSFPSSGYWKSDYDGNTAGAVCTSTAAHLGSAGLWAYTADILGQTWSGTYQEFTASAGQVANGGAWIRTPPPGQWVTWADGSKACVRIEFLDTNNVVLAYKESPAVTSQDSGWGSYTVTTEQAPAGTAKVRFRCYIEKPNNNISVKSVANFDDCTLALSEPPKLEPKLSIYPSVIGMRISETVKTFAIKNTGADNLSWSLSKSDDWIKDLNPASGSLPPDTEAVVTVTASRDGLKNDMYKATITVSSNAGSEQVTIYMDMPGFPVPTQPSIVYTDGYKLMVQKRLPGGSLTEPKPYMIKGAAWSPVSTGSTGDTTGRRNEFIKWYVADVGLMKEAGINTVYLFIDMWPDQRGLEVLDFLYKNGIMAIITVDEDGSSNTTVINDAVNAYKNHPAVLMRALGNEWNILRPDVRKFYRKYDTRQEAALAMEAAAKQIKLLDTNHPVASIMGEIKIEGGENDQPLSETGNIVNNICKSVDVWGFNIYRGDNFGAGSDSLFNQWLSVTGSNPKPLFLSEFGTDAYKTTNYWNSTTGYVDENMQADWNRKLWLEILANLSALGTGKVCAGGTVFEWNDEWWKNPNGSPNVQENSGFETTWNHYAHPDGFANEEIFGQASIGRKTRLSYNTLKELFTQTSLTPIGKKTGNTGQPLQFAISGSSSVNAPLLFSDSGLPSGAVFVDNYDGTSAFSWTPEYNQAGTYYVIFTASDGNGGETSEMVAISVTFSNTYPLEIDKTGSCSGTVTSSPPGINCGSDCKGYFDANGIVTLTAVGNPNCICSGWSGACSGTDTCIVTMDAGKNVTAIFTKYIISGSVKGLSNNQGVQGASIEIRNTGAETLTGSATTDESGNYRVGIPSPGDYTIVASKPNYEDTSASEIVRLTDASPNRAVNLYMSAVGSTITLKYGWNFISLPKGPTITDIAKVLGDESSDVRIVWGYENGNKVWKKWKPNATPNSLSAMEALKGYWIYMNGPGSINMAGWASPPASVYLYGGWNLVGYAGTDKKEISMALSSSSISGKWVIVWNWTDGQWYAKHETISSLPLPIQPLSVLNQNKAYWIMIKPGTATDWAQ